MILPKSKMLCMRFQAKHHIWHVSLAPPPVEDAKEAVEAGIDLDELGREINELREDKPEVFSEQLDADKHLHHRRCDVLRPVDSFCIAFRLHHSPLCE